jgi:transcriptional regulator with XRE-family HTH domain
MNSLLRQLTNQFKLELTNRGQTMVDRVFRGDRLKIMRESRGLSQNDLERAVGVSNVQISRYESGKSEPSLDIVAKFAKSLDVTADYLLGMVDIPEEHLKPQDLSPTELRLLDAFRRGDLRDAMSLLALARDSSS